MGIEASSSNLLPYKQLQNRFINNKSDKMGAVEMTMMGAAYRSFQNWNIERVERYSGEIYVQYLLSIVLTFAVVWVRGGVREIPMRFGKAVSSFYFGPYAKIFFILNYYSRLTQLFCTLNNGAQLSMLE